jgi:predicted PurR-regulated permease PerM
MENKTDQTTGFFIALVLFLGLAGYLLWPFLQLLALAGILAFLFLPVQHFLANKLKNTTLATLITVVGSLIVVVVPLYFLAQAVAKEAVGLYGQYQDSGIRIDRQLLVSRLPEPWQASAVNFISAVSVRVGSWTNSFSLDFKGILSNVAGFLFSFFLLFLTLFYFLKDHDLIAKRLGALLPLSVDQGALMLNKITGAINGVLKGSFLVALLQGVVATAGYLLVGLPQPLFWGVVTVVSAVVPVIGTAVIIVPIIVYLLLFKSWLAALILAIWYVTIHVTIDNVVRPKIIGAQIQTHPLLVLLSVLGGIQVFGALGVMFGPIIMAVCMALIDEYQDKYRKGHSWLW